MENNVSAVVVGLMVAMFGLMGLFLAAGAADIEMLIFGSGLVLFAICFDFGLMRRHYDKRDAVQAAAVRELIHV